MNAHEKEILGVEDASGLASLRDAVVSLLARDAERAQLSAELRAKDDHWRERMEQKTDKTYERVDELTACFAEVPRIIDDKLQTAREELRSETRDAVSDARSRRTMRGFVADWRTWVTFAAGVAATLLAVFR
jgi:hypothetical protein